MIQNSKENDLNLILFIIPLSNPYLNNISENNKFDMLYFMNTLGNDFNIKFFYLYDKYKDLNIWTNPPHVTYNENTLIFSDDILQIILQEMN
jgi:hypothetical protein